MKSGWDEFFRVVKQNTLPVRQGALVLVVVCKANDSQAEIRPKGRNRQKQPRNKNNSHQSDLIIQA